MVFFSTCLVLLGRPLTRSVFAFGTRNLTQRMVVEELAVGLWLVLPLSLLVAALTKRWASAGWLKPPIIRRDVYTTLIITAVGDLFLELLLPSLQCLPAQHPFESANSLGYLEWLQQAWGFHCPSSDGMELSDLLSTDAMGTLLTVRLIFMSCGVCIGEAFCPVAITGGIASGKTTVCKLLSTTPKNNSSCNNNNTNSASATFTSSSQNNSNNQDTTAATTTNSNNNNNSQHQQQNQQPTSASAIHKARNKRQPKRTSKSSSAAAVSSASTASSSFFGLPYYSTLMAAAVSGGSELEDGSFYIIDTDTIAHEILLPQSVLRGEGGSGEDTMIIPKTSSSSSSSSGNGIRSNSHDDDDDEQNDHDDLLHGGGERYDDDEHDDDASSSTGQHHQQHQQQSAPVPSSSTHSSAHSTGTGPRRSHLTNTTGSSNHHHHHHHPHANNKKRSHRRPHSGSNNSNSSRNGTGGHDDDGDTHRYIVSESDSVYDTILKTFGDESDNYRNILNPNNSLIDRNKLGAIVFGNPSLRKQLNRITHPRIFVTMMKHILYGAFWTSRDIVCADIPLLYESMGSLRHMFGLVIVVACSMEVQYQRLKKRNPELTDAQCWERIRSQMPVDRKVELADIVIWNNGDSEEELAQEVERVRREVMGRTYGIGMSLLQMLMLVGGSLSLAVSSKLFSTTTWST